MPQQTAGRITILDKFRSRKSSLSIQKNTISTPVAIVNSSASSFTESVSSAETPTLDSPPNRTPTSSVNGDQPKELGIEYIKPKESKFKKNKKATSERPVVSPRFTSLYTDEIDDDEGIIELEAPKPSFYGLSGFGKSLDNLKNTSTSSLVSTFDKIKNTSRISLNIFSKKNKKSESPASKTGRPVLATSQPSAYLSNYSAYTTYSQSQDLLPSQPGLISHPYGFRHVSSSVTSFNQFSQAGQRSLDLYAEPYLRLSPRASQSTTSLRGHRKSVDYTGLNMSGLYTFREVGGVPNGSSGDSKRWSNPSTSSGSDSDDMNLPPVPPKSALRSNNASRSNTNLLTHSNASSSQIPRSYIISADPPPSMSPSGSSRSSSDNGDRSSTHPFTPPSAMSTFPNADISSLERNKNKRQSKRGASISGDPYKIKDGLTPKESASGVYTPRTLAPVPSRSSTSPNFPTNPSAFMTQTVSLPNTPATPSSSKWFGSISTAATGAYSAVSSYSFSKGKTHQPSRSISSSSSSSTSSYLYTPVSSAREAYFPSVSEPANGKLLQSPIALYTPTMESSPEVGSGPRPVSTWSTTSAGDAPKGKRKPVPKVKEIQEGLEKLNIQNERDEQFIHAL